MTVSNKVQAAINSLKSAQASLQSFVLDTQDKRAKQMYQSAADQAEQVIKDLEERLDELHKENAEYTGL